MDIRLGAVVERLEWGPWGVRALTTDGRVYPADRAVVALPLGVLKAGGVRFVPELPEEKQQAMQRLGLTDAVKLFFRFDQPVFPPGIVELYAPGTSLEEWWGNPLGPSRGIEVLTALATGERARALLALPEERALREALQALRQALGQPSLTPSRARLVHWRDDPYTLGAYSMARVGASEARRVLAEPLGNRLFFAGEHTAPNAWAATVHGAYASGRRAAQEVIRSTYLEATHRPWGLKPPQEGQPAA
ncbi:MAG: FAD-dependent oxidoreductase [Meiothermus sp.]|nr:FAD-dependent oxidoreductase [Meiothermus sp.]MCS7193937.1 FAD-dependent oxidoreductase [Meiothermus sp.]MCX7741335.1 FAD-dependent oxidoreductase [Meiothermus sp.]